jgi:type IV pilus assembly protein PilX
MRMRRGAERGVVLIVALVALVVMSLAGLLMFRATGTGVEVAGNVGFKQNATSLGDLGIEAGRAYLMNFALSAMALDADNSGNGYYASWDSSFDAPNFNWSTAKEVAADDGTGNRVRYIIHRLCSVPGPTTAPGQRCAIPAPGTALGPGGGGAGGPGLSSVVGQAYYRITARVDGPRSTLSYVQVIMF